MNYETILLIILLLPSLLDQGMGKYMVPRYPFHWSLTKCIYTVPLQNEQIGSNLSCTTDTCRSRSRNESNFGEADSVRTMQDSPGRNSEVCIGEDFSARSKVPIEIKLHKAVYAFVCLWPKR